MKFYSIYHLKIFILWFLLIFIWSCQQKTKENENLQKEIKEALVTPKFDADSAFFFLKQQVDFGPRVPNSQSHRICGDYLIEKFSQYSDTVTIQSFQATAYNGKLLKGRNIIASLQLDKKKKILLAAHWDTRHIADQDTKNQGQPIDGANDGASGVAVLLEIARTIHLSDKKPRLGIDIILFDLEDYGAPKDLEKNTKEITYCLGSQYWQKNKHITKYHAYYGILLDMVGGENTKFMMEGVSMQYAPNLMKQVWKIAKEKGYGDFFLSRKTPAILTDDHIFMNKAGIPSIDIIGYSSTYGESMFSPTWHTHQDNIENIDKNLLEAVGQTVLHTIYSE